MTMRRGGVTGRARTLRRSPETDTPQRARGRHPPGAQRTQRTRDPSEALICPVKAVCTGTAALQRQRLAQLGGGVCRAGVRTGRGGREAGLQAPAEAQSRSRSSSVTEAAARGGLSAQSQDSSSAGTGACGGEKPAALRALRPW